MYDKFKRRIHYLRISVTDRCNMRCTYCMPAEGVKLISHEDILSFEEIHEIVSVAAVMGVDKVRLTGGEPLVRRNITTLVKMLSGIQGIKDLAMTTNGSLLKNLALPLRQAGLHRINISLDTLNKEKFRRISRGSEVDDVLEGIKAAQSAGFPIIKLNCVIHEDIDENDINDVKEFALREGLQARFIRKMDLENGEFSIVEGGSGGNCDICNRLRVSSDGKIYPCLFNDRYFHIRDLGIKEALEKAVVCKPESGTVSKNKLYNLGG